MFSNAATRHGLCRCAGCVMRRLREQDEQDAASILIGSLLADKAFIEAMKRKLSGAGD